MTPNILRRLMRDPAVAASVMSADDARHGRRRNRSSSSTRAARITILVGNSPGGINDISARLVARHIGRFIPGNPGAVVQNNPGAGGVITANRLYHNAEKDGTVLAKFERAVPQLAIQGDPNAQFDPDEVRLARQPVVLCRRRLSARDQRQQSGQVRSTRSSRAAASRSSSAPTPRRRATSSSRSSPRRCSASTSRSCAATPARRACSWRCRAARSTASMSA